MAQIIAFLPCERSGLNSPLLTSVPAGGHCGYLGNELADGSSISQINKMLFKKRDDDNEMIELLLACDTLFLVN